VEIAKSQMKFAFGGFDMGRKAEEIRRHVTLVYAAETRHPFVSGILPKKDVLITPKAFETIGKARDIILGLIPRETVGFSTRLEKRALSFACAATLLEYFKSDGNYIPVSEEALKYAVQIYVEEAAIPINFFNIKTQPSRGFTIDFLQFCLLQFLYDLQKMMRLLLQVKRNR